MRREAHVVQFLFGQQTAWHAYFPTLRGRIHELIVRYLCTKARRGSTARQLFGAAKEVFQIDDSTVRERIADVQSLHYIHADPPEDRLTGRSVLSPSPGLLTRYAAYTQALAVDLCAIATMIDPARTFAPPATLSGRQQAQVHATLENYTDSWLATADTLLESANLSAARRLEARRRLMTTSHWTLMHRAIEERYAMLETGRNEGLLADRMAASVLALNGQGIHTTRDHIAALIEMGLFERRRDRVLRVALSHSATQGFHAMLAAFAGELVEAAAGLDTGIPGGTEDVPLAEQTLKFAAPPEMAEATVTGARYRLAIVAPPESARHISLSGEPLNVGRTAANGVMLPDAQVSRTHCRLVLTGGQLLVTDAGSTNGTFVEGRRITEPTPLYPGDKLRVGPFSLMFEPTDDAV
jgi:hypothetical protein